MNKETKDLNKKNLKKFRFSNIKKSNKEDKRERITEVLQKQVNECCDFWTPDLNFIIDQEEKQLIERGIVNVNKSFSKLIDLEFKTKKRQFLDKLELINQQPDRIILDSSSPLELLPKIWISIDENLHSNYSDYLEYNTLRKKIENLMKRVNNLQIEKEQTEKNFNYINEICLKEIVTNHDLEIEEQLQISIDLIQELSDILMNNEKLIRNAKKRKLEHLTSFQVERDPNLLLRNLFTKKV